MPRKTTGEEREKPPAGTHLARCIGVYFSGYYAKTWQEKTRVQEEVILTWELPNVKKKDGTAFDVSSYLNHSLDDRATLCGFLESWFSVKITDAMRKKGIELSSLVGKTCQVIITISEKGYANVDGVAAFPKGLPEPPKVYPTWYGDVDNPGDNTGTAPDWLLKHLLKRVNKDGSKFTGAQPAAPAGGADFPFGASGPGGGDDIPAMDEQFPI